MNSRLKLAACVAMLAVPAGHAFAGQAEDVLFGVQKCATISDDKARLACYDEMAPHVRDTLAHPPSPEEAPRPLTEEEQKSWFGFDLSGLFGSSPARQTTPQQFGNDQLPASKETVAAEQTEVNSITAGVTDYAYTPFGKFIVFLDNGQVWRQIDGDTDHAYFNDATKGTKVTIERGAIGSYNLVINDHSTIFKVKRVK